MNIVQGMGWLEELCSGFPLLKGIFSCLVWPESGEVEADAEEEREVDAAGNIVAQKHFRQRLCFP